MRTPEEALRDIKGFANAGRVMIVGHAWDRMDERGVEAEDVYHALRTASSCSLQDNGRWKVPSQDRVGDDLSLVVVLESGVVVLTLF